MGHGVPSIEHGPSACSTPVDHAVDGRPLRFAEEQVNESNGLWTRCIASLREQVSDTTWQMWLSGVEPVSFDDGVMVLGVPNSVVRDRVESRFLPLIEDTLAVVSGADVEARLQVVDHPLPAPLEPDRPGRPVPTAPPATARREEPAPRIGQGRETAAVSLDPRFTFDTFVAASSNRL